MNGTSTIAGTHVVDYTVVSPRRMHGNNFRRPFATLTLGHPDLKSFDRTVSHAVHMLSTRNRRTKIWPSMGRSLSNEHDREDQVDTLANALLPDPPSFCSGPSNASNCYAPRSAGCMTSLFLRCRRCQRIVQRAGGFAQGGGDRSRFCRTGITSGIAG